MHLDKVRPRVTPQYLDDKFAYNETDTSHCDRLRPSRGITKTPTPRRKWQYNLWMKNYSNAPLTLLIYIA